MSGAPEAPYPWPYVITEHAPHQDEHTILGDSAEEFGARTSPFRRELLIHAYRMLGSIDDAEDAVQEALTRAWRGRGTFQRSISLRGWLYRITTNACLDMIERRKRTPSVTHDGGIGRIPDDVLGDASAEPEARYDAHESVSLAFLTALQLLPPRQRAVLILRDVLAWQAAEVGQLLEISIPAANSALHRARTTIARRYDPPNRSANRLAAVEPGRLRAMLERYVRAWEEADVAGLVALLRDDAVVSMPPAVLIRGRLAIGAFLAESVFAGGVRIRLMPIGANRTPAFALYSGRGNSVLRFYALLVVETSGRRIDRMSVFTDPRLPARFGLVRELPA